MSLAAQITPTGIIAPSYDDILAQLKFAYKTIYGQDAYLEPDSQDGQLLAIFAQAINACNQMAISVYNAYSPASAQGGGLSSVVKINGLKRLSASDSTVDVVIGGVVGTIINGGVVGDDLGLGTRWALPDVVTIPIEGEITVTATSLVEGVVNAPAHSIIKILTPTRNWQTVDNISAASPGQPVEPDATLRQRQSVSTALPAQTVFDAIIAAVANIPGVSRYKGYENDSGTTDDNGIPGHSISLVVEGGDVQAIGEAIANKKTPGTGTYGTTDVLTIDPKGIPNTIHFFQLEEVVLSITIRIKPMVGYVSTTGDAIIASVVQFVNGLDIGEYSYLSRLYGPANLSGDAAMDATGQTQAALDLLSKTYNILSITQSRADPIPETTVTAGPYAAGEDEMTLEDVTEMYVGQQIAITLDNAALLTAIITVWDQDPDAKTGTISFTPAIPGGRSVLNDADVFLVTDISIAFNEAAIAAANNITLTVVT